MAQEYDQGWWYLSLLYAYPTAMPLFVTSKTSLVTRLLLLTVLNCVEVVVCAHERADDDDLQPAAVTVLLLCMLLQHRLTEKGVSEFYSASLASLHLELWWLLFWCEVGVWYRNA
jgi:hypothetical protein